MIWGYPHFRKPPYGITLLDILGWECSQSMSWEIRSKTSLSTIEWHFGFGVTQSTRFTRYFHIITVFFAHQKYVFYCNSLTSMTGISVIQIIHWLIMSIEYGVISCNWYPFFWYFGPKKILQELLFVTEAPVPHCPSSFTSISRAPRRGSALEIARK